MLKLVDYEQRSESWLEWRKGKIGGSIAPAIMQCKDAYLTPNQCYYEILGLTKQQETPAMKRGKDLEQAARWAFEEHRGGIFNPACVEHPEYPELIASLDGLSLDQTELLEIKVCSKEKIEMVKKGVIPDNFFCQISHQLMVTGLHKAWLFCWNGESGTVLEVFRNEDYINNLLIKEREFLEYLRRKEPPPLTNKDYIVRSDQEWLNLANQYKYVSVQLKDLENLKSVIKEKLIRLSENKSCQGGGIRLCHSFRKGAVSMEEIALVLDIEKYRKNPIKTTTILEINNEKDDSPINFD